ncbi:MAG: (Fe-S)-binding protein [Desulfatibacillaceae bacterium]|nr:(Fe-S)-binding protein [Desulfatibacillaceae bacterium]
MKQDNNSPLLRPALLGENAKKCVRCGQCMSVCPVFAQTGLEGDTARGKMALIAHYRQTPGAEQAKRLEQALGRCLLCGACQDICTAKVPTLASIAALRTKGLEELGPKTLVKLQVEALTSQGKGSKALRGAARLARQLMGRSSDKSPGLFLRFPATWFTRRRVAPKLNEKPFLESAFIKNMQHPKPGAVGYFAGCGANHIFDDSAKAFLSLAKKCGLAVYVPKEQECCGMAAFAAGDLEAAAKSAAANIELFADRGLCSIVTTCATCGSFIQSWPGLFPENSPLHARAVQIARLHQDAADFFLQKSCLPEIIRNSKGFDPPLDIWHHRPCHQRFSKAATDGPRLLLASIPGVNIVNAPQEVSCCGHGGSFNIRHYDISRKIGADYASRIRRKKAPIITAGCTGCMMGLMEGLMAGPTEKDGPPDERILHPLEVVLQALE